ncbi:restriction endonuclease FokI C-terminal domain-containing protein [Pelistega europaea]|uniref:Restriction endonuclease n=1 Tax=Pelistega europaea TaxID=106147 RepID=A0A7Y4LB84_9BURK|nr:restriction endonuclease FokI C-terminal domain-containing protein [Pelistega europaea]NOL50374.1 restriction endonuclease [Pelistega europaea]
MIIRTYGWVQNPSSFLHLKKVVQIFVPSSTHYQNLKNSLLDLIPFTNLRQELRDKLDKKKTEFTYTELVGSSKDKNGKSPRSRSNAVANSLIQISIPSQKASTTGKTWTDNWTADGYLRWAISLNFIEVNTSKDTFRITPKGMAFAKTKDDSDEERQVLKKALLAYPPATQILTLLSQTPTQFRTKFALGEHLGFRGEKGFSSYNEELILEWLARETDPAQKKKIRTDVEGTSDKYARGICSWLIKVGLVEQDDFVTKVNNTTVKFPGYRITGSGIHALKQSQGNSSNAQLEKFIMWEFLATNDINRNYTRTRRAYIIKALQEKPLSLKKLLETLQTKGFQDEQQIIVNDIAGLKKFGLRIQEKNKKFTLLDKVNDFAIPHLNLTQELADEESLRRKSLFLKYTLLPPEYIELLDIAYDGKRSRDFEIMTMELFKKIYGMNTVLLGGGRKPDGICFRSTFGIIVDTKAYSEGYSKNISQEDEMVRYITDNKLRDKARNPTQWWTAFPASIENYYFLWVSSRFIGKFAEQLTSTARETKTNGGALNVEQLLLGADMILKKELPPDSIANHFNNKEIFFADSIIDKHQ